MNDAPDDKALKVPPPPRGQRRGLMVPPPSMTPSQAGPGPAPAPLDNMQKPNSGTQDLNFKVDPDFHFAFKMVATKRKMPMKDLLDACFRAWIDTYGDETDKTLLPPK